MSLRRPVFIPVIQEVVDIENLVHVSPQPAIKLIEPLEGVDWERWVKHISKMSRAEHDDKYLAMEAAIREAQR